MSPQTIEEKREASRLRMRAARAIDPNPQKLAVRKWRKKNPDYNRKNHFKKVYGITLEQRNKIFLDQGSKCAICRSEEASRWHIDHCHLTQKIRGILCSHCNLMLGHAKDNTETLLLAVEYLKCSRE